MYDYQRVGLEEKTIFESDQYLFNIFEVQGYRMRAHWHKHLELIYAKQGCSIIGINDSILKLEEGDFIIIFGGTVHSIRNDQGIYEAFLIGDQFFKEMIYDEDFRMLIKQVMNENHLSHVVVKKTDQDYPFIMSQMIGITREFMDKKTGYRMMIKSRLCEVLLLIIRQFELNQLYPIKDNSTVGWIKKAMDYVDCNYMNKITLKDISDITHLSEQYFGRIFKRYTKKTFIEYLTAYRLEMSDWYLKYTDIPITSIPAYIGFCNANYYAKIYKQHYHQTPSETRKKHVDYINQTILKY